jgi:hypothetical protein
MTTSNRSTYRLHVTGVCREFIPTDYRRFYVEGVKGLRAQTQVLCLKKTRKPYNMHRLTDFNSVIIISAILQFIFAHIFTLSQIPYGKGTTEQCCILFYGYFLLSCEVSSAAVIPHLSRSHLH